MTVQFGNNRIFGYGTLSFTVLSSFADTHKVIIWLLAGAVLGLAGHFAVIFLPTLHRASSSVRRPTFFIYTCSFVRRVRSLRAGCTIRDRVHHDIIVRWPLGDL